MLFVSKGADYNAFFFFCVASTNLGRANDSKGMHGRSRRMVLTANVSCVNIQPQRSRMSPCLILRCDNWNA